MDNVTIPVQFSRADYYSLSEVAHAFGVHPNTVRVWIAQGKIPALRVGWKYYISRKDMNLFPSPVMPSAMQA